MSPIGAAIDPQASSCRDRRVQRWRYCGPYPLKGDSPERASREYYKRQLPSQTAAKRARATPQVQNGGRGGIRTHGGFPHARFRVECLKPDSATLPPVKKKTPNVERPTSNIECNFLRLGIQRRRWMLGA